MGVGEGDFHRTRLTHSIEAGQIGEGILGSLGKRYEAQKELTEWLPNPDLIVAACYAHDLGHPPFGHAGEHTLHSLMWEDGGFEGNGQTLRILTRLEKYRERQGINPTRRLILAVLKYPIAYSAFDAAAHKNLPPKCYFDMEKPIVDWALGAPLLPAERDVFTTAHAHGKPAHRSLDCSLMECADDIAYGVHDLEDIVARQLVRDEDLLVRLGPILRAPEIAPLMVEHGLDIDTFRRRLLQSGSSERKSFIGHLVNLFVTSTEIYLDEGFCHPLFRYRVRLKAPVDSLLNELKKLTFQLVIQRPEVRQLERRGQRLVEGLFGDFIANPTAFIPAETWASLDRNDSEKRRVCDYIAGMTDRFAEKIYQRFNAPGFGSSRDEL
jgi:dGTPase